MNIHPFLTRNFLIRKLTTRPIYLWEKNRPYPIINRWRRLQFPSKRPSTDVTVNILCTPSTLAEAAWASYSWKLFAGDYFSVRIIVDGTIDNIFSREFSFADIPIVQLKSLVNPVFFESKTFAKFSHSHKLGNKLLLILSLQLVSNGIYADSDVLLFNRPIEIINSILMGCSAYNSESTLPSYDNSIVAASHALSLNPCDRLNSGLIYFEEDSLSLSLAAKLLETSNYESNFSWFTEQTILSVLLNASGARSLSQKFYVVDPSRQFWWQKDVSYDQVHARHFTGPVRHLMYKFGYPYLLTKK